uniref:Uncharacterized protein n=1 Tax=Rhizophora mucronata TaxID=61149 RepID=A0A2P2QIV9_RHIMU
MGVPVVEVDFYKPYPYPFPLD